MAERVKRGPESNKLKQQRMKESSLRAPLFLSSVTGRDCPYFLVYNNGGEIDHQNVIKALIEQQLNLLDGGIVIADRYSTFGALLLKNNYPLAVDSPEEHEKKANVEKERIIPSVLETKRESSQRDPFVFLNHGGDIFRVSSARLSSSSNIWRNSNRDFFSRSLRAEEEDDEEALKWAAIERLPTYLRIRRGILTEEEGQPKEIDIKSLGLVDKKNLLERLVRIAEEDNEKFLLKLKERIDR
ncbi:hypothetical protein LguiB_012098 [Lonicera macranthoides]